MSFLRICVGLRWADNGSASFGNLMIDCSGFRAGAARDPSFLGLLSKPILTSGAAQLQRHRAFTVFLASRQTAPAAPRRFPNASGEADNGGRG